MIDKTLEASDHNSFNLFPIKFRQIPFNNCTSEVENISSNPRPGWPSLFRDRLKKSTDLVEDVEYLQLDGFRQIPFGVCRGEVGNMSASQWLR